MEALQQELQATIAAIMSLKEAADAVAPQFEAMGGEAKELFDAVYASNQQSAELNGQALQAMAQMSQGQ